MLENGLGPKIFTFARALLMRVAAMLRLSSTLRRAREVTNGFVEAKHEKLLFVVGLLWSGTTVSLGSSLASRLADESGGLQTSALSAAL